MFLKKLFLILVDSKSVKSMVFYRKLWIGITKHLLFILYLFNYLKKNIFINNKMRTIVRIDIDSTMNDIRFKY